MKSIFFTFLAHECRIQLRSLKFQLLSVLYVILNSTLPIYVVINKKVMEFEFGPGAFAFLTSSTLPITTAFLAFVISVDGISRERDEGSYATLSTIPISNATYFLLRYFAILVTLLPLTLLPILFNVGIAMLYGLPFLIHDKFIALWVLLIVPIVVSFAAAGIGIGTFSGGLMPSFFILVLFISGIYITGNWVLNIYGRAIPSLHDVFIPMDPNTLYLDLKNPVNRGMVLAGISDGVIDYRLALRSWWTVLLPLFTVTLLLIAPGMIYLRRSQSDIRPWSVSPTNPIRNFLNALNKWRQYYSPDPDLKNSEKIFALLIFISPLALVWIFFVKDAELRSLAKVRYETERSDGSPVTSPNILPVSYDIDGTISSTRQIDLRTKLKIRNAGTSNEDSFSFMLNPFLSVTSVFANSKSISFTHKWDRLCFKLPEPLLAGQEIQIEFTYKGAPETFNFPVPQYDINDEPIPFLKGFRMVDSNSSIVDFSKTRIESSISSRRIFLKNEGLVPILRYTKWDPNEKGEVLAEKTKSFFNYKLHLTFPKGILAADSSGNLSHSMKGYSVLNSETVRPVTDVTVVGGPFMQIKSTLPVGAFFIFPEHQLIFHNAKDTFREWANLTESETLAQQNPVSHAVLIEWPPEQLPVVPFVQDVPLERKSIVDAFCETEGKILLLYEERPTTSNEHLPQFFFASSTLAAHTAQYRLVKPSEIDFFRRWFFWYYFMRFTRDRTRSSIVDDQNRIEFLKQISLFDSEETYRYNLHFKTQRILLYLQMLIGERALHDGMREFLKNRDSLGDSQQMFNTIGRFAGKDLSLFYSDFVAGKALPKIDLADASSEKDRDGWLVRFSVKNQGAGHVECPVEIQSASGTSQVIAVIGPKETRSLSALVDSKPLKIFLDPDNKVVRAQPIGTIRALTLD
jgi:hypothetical protein